MDGVRLSTLSRASRCEKGRGLGEVESCGRRPTSRKRDFVTKAPRRPATWDHRASGSCEGGVDCDLPVGGAPLANKQRGTRGSRSCPRAESCRRSRRTARTRVCSKMEGAQVGGSHSTFTRSVGKPALVTEWYRRSESDGGTIRKRRERQRFGRGAARVGRQRRRAAVRSAEASRGRDAFDSLVSTSRERPLRSQ